MRFARPTVKTKTSNPIVLVIKIRQPANGRYLRVGPYVEISVTAAVCDSRERRPNR